MTVGPWSLLAIAFAAGMAIFTLSKRSVGAGFVGGVAVFAGLALWRLGGV